MSKNEFFLNQLDSDPLWNNFDERKKRILPSKRKSCFLITINSNKSLKGMTYEEAEEFAQKYDAIISEFVGTSDRLGVISKCIILQSVKSPQDFVDVPFSKRIESIELEYCNEIAPNTEKLHSHIALIITKRAISTKLNTSYMKTWLQEKFGYGIYVNYRLHKNSEILALEYTKKTSQLSR